MKLEQWLEKLKKSRKPIIVEGIKDKKALEQIGLKDIFTLKEPLFAIVETIANKYKEIIILTDLDKKGRELYGRLKRDLEKQGVKVDCYFREFLFKNTKLRQIESIANYIA